MCVNVLNVREMCKKHPHKFADAEILCKHTHTHTHTHSCSKKSHLNSTDNPVRPPLVPSLGSLLCASMAKY